MAKLVLCCTIVCGPFNFYIQVNQQSSFPKPSKCTGALHQNVVLRIIFFINKTTYLKTPRTLMSIDSITTYRNVVHMTVIFIFLLKIFKYIFFNQQITKRPPLDAHLWCARNFLATNVARLHWVLASFTGMGSSYVILNCMWVIAYIFFFKLLWYDSTVTV